MEYRLLQVGYHSAPSWGYGGAVRFQSLAIVNGATVITANLRPQANASTEMLQDMKRDMFPLADFIDSYCDITNGNEVKTGDLYDGYLH